MKDYIDYISKKQPTLGNHAICPFVKHSHYKIIECSAKDIKILKEYDALVFVVENDITLDKMNEWIDHYNKVYENWLFFEDHSTVDSFIGEVRTNNGVYNLIIAQPKEKLMKFRESLKKTDYYSYWDKEYYEKIMKG